MPKHPERGSSSSGETPRFAETTPPTYQGSDYSFTLQAVLDIQSRLGGLIEAVATLKSDSKSHGDKLEKLSQKIHGATWAVIAVGAVLSLIGSIIGFLLKEGMDYLSAHPPH